MTTTRTELPSTEFRILCHAGMQVTCGSKSLVTDPWINGTCYWKSWFNYPPLPEGTLEQALQADAIYLSHVHWDHWHGPTLRKFSRDTLILTHAEANCRSVRDLRSMGFKNIKTLLHGETYQLGEIRITPYQFGLYLVDSAVVVETPTISVLNANDAKLAGGTLRHVCKRHGPFDFALRSHSTANDRACYKIAGRPIAELDDNEHYSRSFLYFMQAVKPKYAIPFASNHVHLHPEALGFNKRITNPYRLAATIERLGQLDDNTTFQVMLPGDRWDSGTGFEIDDRVRYFEDSEKHIEEYREASQPSIERYLKKERKERRVERLFEKLSGLVLRAPRWKRKCLKNVALDISLTYAGEIGETFEFHPYTGEFHRKNEATCSIEMRIPAIVFSDAVLQNMFHHAGISKRMQYICKTDEDARILRRFNGIMNMVELELFPLKMGYLKRTIRSYTRRWREVLTYVHAAYMLKRFKLPMPLVEEELLQGSWRPQALPEPGPIARHGSGHGPKPQAKGAESLDFLQSEAERNATQEETRKVA